MKIALPRPPADLPAGGGGETVPTSELTQQGRSKRRKKTQPLLEGFAETAAATHYPGMNMPEKASRRERALFIAHSITAYLDSSGHAAMLHCYRGRINRIVHYLGYWKEPTCKMQAIRRAKRKSVISNLLSSWQLSSSIEPWGVYKFCRASGHSGGLCLVTPPMEFSTQAPPSRRRRSDFYFILLYVCLFQSTAGSQSLSLRWQQ
jgi:hypothetical protein